MGKTNILEAIFLLATGKSFRATREQQMIWYGQELGRVIGIKKDDKLEILLTTGEVQGERAPRKRYLVNEAGKRKMDFVGRLMSVLFRPEDIEFLEDGNKLLRDIGCFGAVLIADDGECEFIG